MLDCIVIRAGPGGLVCTKELLVVSQIKSRTRKFPRRKSNLGGYSEDLIDETDLSHDIPFFHILDLSFSDHIHRFIAFERSSG